MNKRLFKREISNLIMLCNIAKQHGIIVFFWSLADGVCRRIHLNSFYEKTHYKRHEACKKYLKKKYWYIIEKYKEKTVRDISRVGEDSVVWRYWHQGVANVPYPVDVTINSTKGKVGKHEVKVLDSDSYKQYVDIPDYIVEKCEKGKMNIAVFSDYLRVALLRRYGGIWLDSTFYMNQAFSDDLSNRVFYTINQGNKRKWVVTRDKWSVGLMACGPHNILMEFCEEFLREYWKNENSPIAYLMTDCIIGIAYEEIPSIKNMIDDVPINNTHCFAFLSEFRNEGYDEVIQNEMNKDTNIYQLSYKFDWKIKGDKDILTNFGGLVKNDSNIEE